MVTSLQEQGASRTSDGQTSMAFSDTPGGMAAISQANRPLRSMALSTAMPLERLALEVRSICMGQRDMGMDVWSAQVRSPTRLLL